MKIRIGMISAVVTAGLLVGVSSAHHALEYIELESYNTTEKGEKLIYLQYDYSVFDADQPGLDRWEITPGIAYGITDRLMVDVHTHYAKFREDHIEEGEREAFEKVGPSPFFEAVAASVLYRLTEEGPLHAAVSGGVELPFSRARRLLGSKDPVYFGTLIFGRDFGVHGNVIANIGYESEGSDDEWFWGLGIKSPIGADPHGIAAGLEVHGDFDGDRWSVLPGLYVPLRETIQLKAGFEFGQEKRDEGGWASTSRFSTSVMVRF